MTLLLYLKLTFYYLFHIDIHIAEVENKRLFCVTGHYPSCLYVPYTSNVDLDVASTSTKTAVIIVHGILKNSHAMCNGFMQAMPKAAVDSSIVVCPQFITQSDANSQHLHDVLTWSFEGWDRGEVSNIYVVEHEGYKDNVTVSSFSVLDTFIKNFLARKKYPSLQKIIVVGFSAGGQLTQRYAAMTPTDQNVADKKVSIIFVPISSSSFLYLTDGRPTENQHVFRKPLDKWLTGCPKYNWYKYGLKHKPNNYVYPADPTIISNYATKKIIYVVGKNDNKKWDIFLDRQCGATIQGSNRLNRLSNYLNYLGSLYGTRISQFQEKVEIDGVDHDYQEIVSSPKFKFLVKKLIGFPDV